MQTTNSKMMSLTEFNGLSAKVLKAPVEKGKASAREEFLASAAHRLLVECASLRTQVRRAQRRDARASGGARTASQT